MLRRQRSCGGFAGLATYWAAYDTMAKAVELLPADSEYMEHAKSSLSKFRSVFPSSEECFFNELQEGARYTVNLRNGCRYLHHRPCPLKTRSRRASDGKTHDKNDQGSTLRDGECYLAILVGVRTRMRAALRLPEETMMTEYSEDLSVVMSQNGRRSYHFVTPLLEGYSLAREPYREFRKGVKITTYQNDSLTTVDAVLTANYAIYYVNRELWEAKGNVVVEKSDGKTLYTQQLFWNARTKKIYSNVDSKIVQNNGRDVFIGEGFESDEEFKDWRFRRMKGRMEVEMKQSADSAATDSTSVRPVPKPDSRPSDSRSALGRRIREGADGPVALRPGRFPPDRLKAGRKTRRKLSAGR